MRLSNKKVASVSAKITLLNDIPAEELKKSIIVVIEKEGLTFGEQSFLTSITNCWTSDKWEAKRYKGSNIPDTVKQLLALNKIITLINELNAEDRFELEKILKKKREEG